MYHTVLPDDVKYLDEIINFIDKPIPNREADKKIHFAFTGTEVEEPPFYTSDLNVALTLIPHGWWWHISHLEVAVCPNRAEPDYPISNAMDYRFGGRPIEYSTSLWGEREGLPSAVCTAMLRAKCALKTKAAAIRDNRMYMVQTGRGPMLVDKDGKLKEMPSGAWLGSDGTLIARKEVFPQYDFTEREVEEDD